MNELVKLFFGDLMVPLLILLIILFHNRLFELFGKIIGLFIKPRELTEEEKALMSAYKEYWNCGYTGTFQDYLKMMGADAEETDPE
jgi:hypothetical protein